MGWDDAPAVVVWVLAVILVAVVMATLSSCGVLDDDLPETSLLPPLKTTTTVLP